jgi:2-dehydro-3-deoxyphosphogalactonate aldolase
MENMAGYRAAGAAGFGIGSSLYKPGVSAAELKERADKFMRHYREIGSRP